MTDDEMQALRDLSGCGCFRERGWDNDGSALELARECPACLRLLADAVVRQRLAEPLAWIKGLVLISEDSTVRPHAMSYVKPSEYRKLVESKLAAMTGETK